MFITDKETLKWYTPENRVWQGIPGIERTKKGRLFITFYSGFTSETFGNYVLALKSDDDGANWEPVACVDKPETVRYFDSVLWIDPLGRLWLTWAKAGEKDAGVYGAICQDPDADELEWSETFLIGGEVMMNKPTVLSTGEWIFPCSSWAANVGVVPRMWSERPWYGPENQTGAFVIMTKDCGKTFQNVGSFIAPNRLYDEHMFVELPDGVLMLINRVKNGMYKAYSYDWGKTWKGAAPFNLPNPSTRMFIRRLKSGRLLCINNCDAEKRINLTAYLSEDNGATWIGGLLLDERSEVSYPDAVETEDGFIYAIYDRERGSHKKTWEENRACAKEFLLAKFTEEDILAKAFMNPESYTKRVISKLTEYTGEKDYYAELDNDLDHGICNMLMKLDGGREQIVAKIMKFYLPSSAQMATVDTAKADVLIKNILEDKDDLEKNIRQLMKCFEAAGEPVASRPIVDKAIEYIRAHATEDYTAEAMAEQLGVSSYYLAHLFREHLGATPVGYRNIIRMQKAKEMLCSGKKSVSDIAIECGFNSQSYFIKKFREFEGMTPIEYRERVAN